MQMGLLYKTNFFLLAFNAWGKNCLWINIMHSHGLLQNMLEVEICLRSFFGLKKSYLNRFIMQARGNALQFYAIFESLRKAHCSLFTVFTMVSSSLTTLSWEIKLSIMSFHFLPGSWWTLRWSGTENLLLATALWGNFYRVWIYLHKNVLKSEKKIASKLLIRGEWVSFRK